MPAYIELDKNTSVPAASQTGRVIFSINNLGLPVITDSTGYSAPFAIGVSTGSWSSISESLVAHQLVPGTFYKISGSSPAHYGGTDIILLATTTASLSTNGYGKFFNPRYDQNIEGYGVWTPYVHFQINSLESGIFIPEETVTGDGGQTAVLQYYVADGGYAFLNTSNSPYTGDWTSVTRITGNISNATASISNVVLPTYNEGNRVIWGGKIWENTDGELGASSGIFSLSPNWTLIPYNDTDYDVVWDEIEYDIVNDFITMRKDKSNNIVRQSYFVFYWMEDYSAISAFQWGNEINGNFYKGFGTNTIKDSYFECINFRGDICQGNNIINLTAMGDTTWEVGTIFRNNVFDDCGVWGNFFGGNNVYIQDNKGWYSGIYSNILVGYGEITGNEFNDSEITNNIIVGSEISYNTIDDGYISNNQIILGDYGQIDTNVLANSGIYGNILYTSYIRTNTLHGSSQISNNSLSQNSVISYNNLTADSDLNSNILGANSSIDINSISNISSINGNTISTGSYIQRNNISSGGSINDNLIDQGSHVFDNIISGESVISNNILGVSAEIFTNVVQNASLINFNQLSSSIFKNNSIRAESSLTNNTLVQSCNLSDNDVTAASAISGNILFDNSNLRYNCVANNSIIFGNEISVSSNLGINTITNQSGINNNVVSSSGYLENNSAAGSSFIGTNVVFSSLFSANTLAGASSIGNNTTYDGNASMLYNMLNSGATINGITIGNAETIQYNSICNQKILPGVTSSMFMANI